MPLTSYDLLEPKPKLTPYRRLGVMFRAMAEHRKAHPETVFWCADRPEEKCVGFWDEATQTGWHIAVIDLWWKETGYDVRALFFTREGRENLASQLTRGEFPKCQFPRVAPPTRGAARPTPAS